MYAAYAAALVLLNKALGGVPLSLGLYFAMLACGANIIAAPLLYVAASAVHVNYILTLLSLFEAGFLCAVTFVYRRTKRKIKFEAAAYLILSLSLYIVFAPWNGIDGFGGLGNEYALKAVAAAAVAAFAFFCYKTVYALLFRIYRCRLKEDELVCCAVVFAAAGAGLYNLIGFGFYTAVAAGLLVLCVRIARSPAAIISALMLAMPPALVCFTPAPLTAYVTGATLVLLFSRAGRFASGAVGGGLAAVYCYFSGGYDCAAVSIVFRALLLFCCVLLPSLPSDAVCKKIKNALLVKEVLPEAAVERSRRRTGEKLYRISEVFREIECAFNALGEDINEKSARERILEHLKEKCCKDCERSKKCAKTDVYAGFTKLIDTGSVKGKVSLIDLPSEVTANCSDASGVLKRLNALIADYRRFMTEAENAKSGRALLAEQARGVAEVMKACAVELCKTYSEYSDLEELIKVRLAAQGVSCPELYINDEDMEITAVTRTNADIKVMTEIFADAVKRRYLLKDKMSYDGEKCCLVFGAPPRLDAAFGVAYAIKEGEKASGDTHSVIKINEHSFLMALSDGMGSGEYAKKVSATAISLIEAFYRAEMPEGTVLNTINKLLSFNRDERFTCIDVAAVDLNTGVADFVKIGSPAGIIVRENEIKVLESRSLPLGILDNLRPTVCSEQLKGGDIVVFMSDGITSAFPSPTDLYAFMQELKPLNPQSLADKILAGALARTEQAVADDMTVVCTRIFEK